MYLKIRNYHAMKWNRPIPKMLIVQDFSVCKKLIMPEFQFNILIYISTIMIIGFIFIILKACIQANGSSCRKPGPSLNGCSKCNQTELYPVTKRKPIRGDHNQNDHLKQINGHATEIGKHSGTSVKRDEHVPRQKVKVMHTTVFWLLIIWFMNGVRAFAGLFNNSCH